MKIECFLDTNILIYAAAGRKHEARKQRVSERIILSADFCLSGQVLAEFYVNVTQKPDIRLTSADVDEWLDVLQTYPIAAVDSRLVQRGIFLARRFRINYWDASLIAAAERLDAPILYTEDLNHDQLYGSVRVINPFRPN